MVKRRRASLSHQMLPNDDRLKTYLLHDAVIRQQLLFQVPRHQLRVGLPCRGGEAPAEPQPKDHGGGGTPAGAPCPAGERKARLPAAAACAAGWTGCEEADRRRDDPPSSPPSQLGTCPFSTQGCFPSCQGLQGGILAGFPSCSYSPQPGVPWATRHEPSPCSSRCRPQPPSCLMQQRGVALGVPEALPCVILASAAPQPCWRPSVGGEETFPPPGWGLRQGLRWPLSRGAHLRGWCPVPVRAGRTHWAAGVSPHGVSHSLPSWRRAGLPPHPCLGTPSGSLPTGKDG